MLSPNAMKLIRILFTLYYWVWFLLVSIICCSIATVGWLLTFWWDPKRRLSNIISWYWSWAYFLGNPLWRVKITGREKIDNNIPTLLLPNHLSTFDIFALFVLRKHYQWVSKHTNLRIPLMGLDMIYTRTIFLNRDSPRDVFKMVKASIERLKEGISLIIFPEGERSPTGRLQPLLGGAFAIAKKADVRIQPIALTGTYDIIPREHFLMGPFATVTVTVLDPIPVEVVREKSADELNQMVYEQLKAALPPEYQPLPTATSE